MLLSLKVWNPTYAFTWSIRYLGAQIYGRVQVDPVQSLGSGFSVHIEKVFLCSGRDGYIPKYQPANSEYGCLADAPNLLYRFKVIVSTPTQKRLISEFTKPTKVKNGFSGNRVTEISSFSGNRFFGGKNSFFYFRTKNNLTQKIKISILSHSMLFLLLTIQMLPNSLTNPVPMASKWTQHHSSKYVHTPGIPGRPERRGTNSIK